MFSFSFWGWLDYDSPSNPQTFLDDLMLLT